MKNWSGVFWWLFSIQFNSNFIWFVKRIDMHHLEVTLCSLLDIPVTFTDIGNVTPQLFCACSNSNYVLMLHRNRLSWDFDRKRAKILFIVCSTVKILIGELVDGEVEGLRPLSCMREKSWCHWCIRHNFCRWYHFHLIYPQKLVIKQKLKNYR